MFEEIVGILKYMGIALLFFAILGAGVIVITYGARRAIAYTEAETCHTTYRCNNGRLEEVHCGERGAADWAENGKKLNQSLKEP